MDSHIWAIFHLIHQIICIECNEYNDKNSKHLFKKIKQQIWHWLHKNEPAEYIYEFAYKGMSLLEDEQDKKWTTLSIRFAQYFQLILIFSLNESEKLRKTVISFICENINYLPRMKEFECDTWVVCVVAWCVRIRSTQLIIIECTES